MYTETVETDSSIFDAHARAREKEGKKENVSGRVRPRGVPYGRAPGRPGLSMLAVPDSLPILSKPVRAATLRAFAGKEGSARGEPLASRLSLSEHRVVERRSEQGRRGEEREREKERVAVARVAEKEGRRPRLLYARVSRINFTP